MVNVKAGWLILGAVTMPLLTAGCLGGGGNEGSSSLFGGGELAGLFGSSGGSDGGAGGSGSALSSSEGGPSVPEAATLHNPEPASLALFAGGLAGLMGMRRLGRRRRSR